MSRFKGMSGLPDGGGNSGEDRTVCWSGVFDGDVLSCAGEVAGDGSSFGLGAGAGLLMILVLWLEAFGGVLNGLCFGGNGSVSELVECWGVRALAGGA